MGRYEGDSVREVLRSIALEPQIAIFFVFVAEFGVFDDCCWAAPFDLFVLSFGVSELFRVFEQALVGRWEVWVLPEAAIGDVLNFFDFLFEDLEVFF